MFYGSMVALVTPLLENGDLDLPTFCQLIDWHIENGTSGIVVSGSTGEGGTLTDAEKILLFRTAVKHARERIPIIAGTGTQSTAHAISLTRSAMAEGVDACLVVTPAYIKPTQEGLYRHYAAIAQAVGIPIILYNVPGRAAVDLLPETVARLSTISNIVGIKEAADSLTRTAELIAACSGRINVYSGDDLTVLNCLANGGKGVISVTGNVVPKMMHDLVDAALNNDLARADEIQTQLMPLHRSMFVESNPIPVKYALARMKRISGGIRLPLTPLSESGQAVVQTELARLELISK